MGKKQINFNLTFFDIAYSLGGRQNVEKAYKVLNDIYTDEGNGTQVSKRELLSEEENKVLECMVATYKAESIFPSWTYLQSAFHIVSNAPIRNLGDLGSAVNMLLAKRAKEYMAMELSNSMVRTTNVDELKDQIQAISDKFKGHEVVNPVKAFESIKGQYDFAKNAPQGLTSGVEQIDLLTAGFQGGTVAVVAGFTSHGKSTISNNLAYLNAKDGRKVGVVSLEITKLLTSYIFLSRHSYSMDKRIPYQNIVRNHLSEEDYKYMFEKVEPDFKENIAPNLAIVETDDIPAYTPAGFELLYQQIEDAIGGLDLIIWDHVTQFKFLGDSQYTGDHYIKFLTDLTKTYVNKKGNHPVSLFVAQTNREGHRRASRNDGRYELNALSDFNELERSATYVIFTYADEVMRGNNQSKIQLLKHRLGMVQLAPEEVDVSFPYASVGEGFNNVISNIASDQLDAATSSFMTSGGGQFDYEGDTSFADMPTGGMLDNPEIQDVDPLGENMAAKIPKKVEQPAPEISMGTEKTEEDKSEEKEQESYRDSVTRKGLHDGDFGADF